MSKAAPDPARLTLPWALAVIAGLTLLTYWRSLSNAEVGFDDTPILESNQTATGTARLLWGMGLARNDPEHPRPLYRLAAENLYRALFGRNLTILTHALDDWAFGADPWGHHLMNVVYHILACCAACVLARALSGSVPVGLAAALFFSLHPLQTESVAYIAGRRDVLFCLFYFLGFRFWLKHREENRARPAILAGICWILSVLSKEAGVTLPLTVLAHEALRGDARKLWARHGSLLLKLMPVAVAAVVLIISQHADAPDVSSARRLGVNLLWYGGSAAAQWASVPRIALHALGLVLWPQTLNGDYSFNAFPASHSFMEPEVLLCVLILGAVAASAWRLARNDKLIRLGLLWTTLTYLPQLPIIPAAHNQQVFAEHWLYLPLFGPSLIFGVVSARAMGTISRGTLAVPAAMLAAFMWRAALRNADWKDELTFWSKTVSTAPNCARAHCNLGYVYFLRDKRQEAVREFQRAIDIAPLWYAPRQNLGHALAYWGRYEEAVSVFRASVRLNPAPAVPLANLVSVYLALGQSIQAADICGQPVRNSLLLHNCGALYLLTNHYDIAEKAYKMAISGFSAHEDANLAMAHASLGAFYVETGRVEEAVAQLQESLRINPGQSGTRASLGLAYGKLGRLRSALNEVQEARRLGLPGQQALIDQGIIFRDLRLWQKSLEALGQALEAQPSADVWFHLGQTYAAMKDPRGAERSYRRAVAMGDTRRSPYFLAVLLADQGRRGEAAALARALVRSYPHYDTARKLLSSIETAGGEPRKSGSDTRP